MLRNSLIWCLAAIAGVVLVAGVTYAASGLSTQAIGLSSEPLSAGENLAPKDAATPASSATPDRGKAAAERRRKAKARARARSTPTPAPVPTVVPTPDDNGGSSVPAEPGDDSGGHGSNRGSGGGSSGEGGGDD
jgi:hypothetical protein